MDVLVTASAADSSRTIATIMRLDSDTDTATPIDPPDVEECRALVPRGITPAADAGSSWVYFSCSDWQPEERQLATLDVEGEWTLQGERFHVPGATGSFLTTFTQDEDEVVLAGGGAGGCAVEDGHSTCTEWADLDGQCSSITRPQVVGGSNSLYAVVQLGGVATVLTIELSSEGEWTCGSTRPSRGSTQGSVGPDAILLEVTNAAARIEQASDGSVLSEVMDDPAPQQLWVLASSEGRAVVCTGPTETQSLTCSSHRLG